MNNELFSEEVFCEFTSFQHWVNHARSWLGGISGGGQRYKAQEQVVCVDAKGRICKCGADFKRAENDNAYPVKAFLQHTPRRRRK